MARIALVLGLVWLAPASAGAQAKGTSPDRPAASGAEAAKPPRQARGLARAITSEESWNEIIDSYAASLSGQMSAALSAEGKEPPEDLREKVRAELGDAVRYDQAIELQASALALRFSPGELTELERFYRSAAGKKLVELLPDVSRDVNDEVRERLSRRIPAIVERHAPALAAGQGRPAETSTGAREPSKDPAQAPAKEPSPGAQEGTPPGGTTPGQR